MKAAQGGRWIAHKHATSTFGSGAMTVRNREREETLVSKETARAGTTHQRYHGSKYVVEKVEGGGQTAAVYQGNGTYGIYSGGSYTTTSRREKQ